MYVLDRQRRAGFFFFTDIILQQVGYAIRCDGTSITVKEDSIRHLWPEQRIQYLGVDRKRWLYLLGWQGEPGKPAQRIKILTPFGRNTPTNSV